MGGKWMMMRNVIYISLQGVIIGICDKQWILSGKWDYIQCVLIAQGIDLYQSLVMS